MATYLNYPFDPELFLYRWENEKDMTLTRIVESGAVQQNATLADLISKGSDTYTLPFYGLIGGTPVNYDGATNITSSSPTGSSQNGIVYGRAAAWTKKDFVFDFNSGADPMAQIVRQVAKYWRKHDQSVVLSILNAVFGITGTSTQASWNNHTTDISSASTTVTAANKMGATTIGEATQKACGDAADQFAMAIMHSKVATGMSGLQLLDFAKYTDERGIERPLKIGYANGLLVIVDDGCPVTAATQSVAEKYTTYVLGTGAIQTANAPVENPVEVSRDPATNGGQDTLYTRVRKTYHPNGFSFTKPASGYTASPTDAQLAATANWSLAAGVDPKSIALCKIVTNG